MLATGFRLCKQSNRDTIAQTTEDGQAYKLGQVNVGRRVFKSRQGHGKKSRGGAIWVTSLFSTIALGLAGHVRACGSAPPPLGIDS